MQGFVDCETLRQSVAAVPGLKYEFYSGEDLQLKKYQTC